MLWPHQSQALEISVINNFQSGTHAHATGSGKSILGHALVRAYAERYPGKLIFWLCEQTSVIAEIFSRPEAKKGLIVCDLVTRKPHDWWSTIQSALYWNRPVIVIINRAFLVSQTRYKKIRASRLGLIIHDECHSGIGTTTKEFYTWIQDQVQDIKVIGLSATPAASNLVPYPPMSNILSRFSIYDATIAGVIVPLRICWYNSILDHKRNLTIEDSGRLTLILAKQESIQKIIVWCGMIEHCFRVATSWKQIFPSEWLFAVDTSIELKYSKEWSTYHQYVSTSANAILFCAAKHREGSDIPKLGMGVFVDGVEHRGSAVFVQCAGRVIRRSTDPTKIKPYGLILDLKAKNGLELCDRVGEYLQLPAGVMPWINSQQQIDSLDINIKYLTLSSIDNQKSEISPTIECLDSNPGISFLKRRFVRTKVPRQRKFEYKTRLKDELQLIYDKGLIPHMLRALEVLDMAGSDVPHVTRGSSGSSLVCYFLGISHVDPIKHGICFARFLNPFRSSLPDIDFDFPHNRRADIFLRMAIQWPGKIARISNHIHYHEKSAIRQSLRNHGLKGHVPVVEMEKYLKSLPIRTKQMVEAEAEAMEGEFNCYSLHCGGVVYYPNGIPKEDLLEEKSGKLISQVKLDKRDIGDVGHFKIDILSSRALAQLIEAFPPDQTLELDKPPFTKEMEDLFANGHNLGLTLAESPLIRSELKIQKPKSVDDIAACLSLIRPAARESKGELIYDDDIIEVLHKEIGCSLAEADGYRRRLAKKELEVIKDLSEKLGHHKFNQLKEKLGSVSLYGFCKAHAMSYAQLICWLAWCKIEYPIAFWRGALNNCHSNYKPWVHFWEAQQVGLDPFSADLIKNDRSIYAESKKKKFRSLRLEDQLKSNWYWDTSQGFISKCFYETFETGEAKFTGVIAAHRRISKKSLAISFGTGDGYYEILCFPKGFTSKSRLVSGDINGQGEVIKIKFR